MWRVTVTAAEPRLRHLPADPSGRLPMVGHRAIGTVARQKPKRKSAYKLTPPRNKVEPSLIEYVPTV